MAIPPLPPELVDPHPDRCPPDPAAATRVAEVHRLALALGESGYVDPLTGYWVHTAATLWARGDCCDSGCRHCPFVARS
ncbi:MAG TPA: DUF5522 domain-containing protein [Acidimicrobiales bacterium]|nr:DUF5522 domain-containing protein [Acidimicrobiales bacterium]